MCYGWQLATIGAQCNLSAIKSAHVLLQYLLQYGCGLRCCRQEGEGGKGEGEGETLITFCHCGQMVRQLDATLERAMVYRTATNRTCLSWAAVVLRQSLLSSVMFLPCYAVHIHRGSVVAVEPRSVN